MLTARDEEIARRLKATLVAAGIPVLDLLVFGSRARGTAGPDSDMDVCLILGDTAAATLSEVGRIAREVGFEEGVVTTTVEFTRDQIEGSPLRASPFVRAVRSEGVAI